MDFENISAEELFSSSLQAFRNTLRPHERDEFKQFSTAEAMIGELKLHHTFRGNTRIEQSCARVARFAQRLEPYFDVIGAFVQTNPEYVGWFWGAALLVCKLGGNYAGFFEKTSQMLEDIANCLPQYKDYIAICRKRKDSQNNRIMKSLALVYADIVNFCQQIHAMLTGRRGSPKWKRRVALVGDVLWTPFDTRFSQLLERLKRHDSLFRQEVQLQDSEAIHRIQKTLDMQYQTLQNALDKMYTKADVTVERNVQDNLKKHIDTHVRLVKTWMGNVDYRSVYEHAKHNRRDGSGQWFLSLDDYTNWRDKPPEDRSCDYQRTPAIQIVHAKPGFGKTFLSTVIIDDLQSHQPVHPTPSHGLENLPPAVAYFHFTRTSNLGINGTTTMALRAIVTQLVHCLRDEPSVIDVLAVLMGHQGSGQLEASYEDVYEALAFLLEAYPTYLVVDGVDECEDSDFLLSTLAQLCNRGSCRLLLLSRPEITLPRSLSKLCGAALNLTAEHNFDDILEMIATDLEELVEQGGFGTRSISAEAPLRASRHANGMFLWARLFMSYLRSPALTPKMRHQFLVDAINFDGLSGLIQAILERLNERNRHEVQTARNIFRWIAASLHPLSVDTLHIALAITPGEATTDLDYLPNFPACLPMLTGCLVEIDPFKRPAFIHVSVKDSLISSRSKVPEPLSLGISRFVHEHLANCCLSYLTHDVPKRPIRPLRPGVVSKETRADMPPPVHAVQQGQLDTGRLTPAAALELLHSSRAVGPVETESSSAAADDSSHMHKPQMASSPASQRSLPFSQSHFSPPLHNNWHYRAEPQQLSLPPGTQLNSLQTFSAMSDPLAPAEEEKDATMVGDNASMENSFIRYATLCWVQHLWLSISPSYRDRPANSQMINTDAVGGFAGTGPKIPPQVLLFPAWIPLLSRFLLCRAAVTNWTESSFHYHMTPTVNKLASSIQNLGAEFPEDTAEAREVHWIVHGMNQLSEALNELATEYKTSLQQNPTLIWQRDITSATDSSFWPVWGSSSSSGLVRQPNGCWTGEPFELRQSVEDFMAADTGSWPVQRSGLGSDSSQ